MAQPTKKQSFIQTLLLMTTIYLGVVLFMQVFRPSPDNRSADEVFKALQTANREMRDLDAAKILGAYREKIKVLPEAERKVAETQALILTADTQLKAGMARNDTNRLRTAYHTLQAPQRVWAGAEHWNAKHPVFDVSGDPRFGWKEWSGEGLYGKIVERIVERNRTDLIWGFIPGGFQLIDFLVNLTGAQPAFSYAFAAFLLALIVRIIIFPLAQKQLMFGRQMSQLSPLLKELQAQYKDKPQELQMKTMELYRSYGINPAAGCWPVLLQMPLFLTVYQCMLHYQFEFERGTFLWINPHMAQVTNGFIAPNLGRLDYILIVVYGISMVASTLLMPVSDPTQVRTQRLIGIGMSVFFTVMMFFDWFPVPAGFVLYWTFTNILSTIQSLRAYRLPLPPLQKVAAPSGGMFPFGLTPPPGSNGSSISNGEVKTGRPVKHKPKKRK